MRKIKNVILFFLKHIFRFISLLWPYSAVIHIRKLKTKIHTLWISSEFKSLGSNSTICYPIVLKGGQHITIGNNTGLGKRGTLTAWDNYMDINHIPQIIIGNNTSIGEDYHITAMNKIQIGNNVLMGKKITITDNSHGKTDLESISHAPAFRALYSKGAVIIHDGVWIGDKATILPGVVIGKNSVIGANSLVTKDIPSNSVFGGVPAKEIKKII